MLHRLSSWSTVQASHHQYWSQNQPITFDHFRVEFCPILDKMMFYSSLHLYCIKSSAKCFKISHCRERMAWTTKAENFLFSIQHNTDQKCRMHMYKLNPTIPSQIRVMLMLRSIVATQNSAITQFRLKKKLAGFWTLLNLRLQLFHWIYCYFIYLFFKTFKIRIVKVKIVFPYFEGIFVQNMGNSYYLAGLMYKILLFCWKWSQNICFVNKIKNQPVTGMYHVSYGLSKKINFHG